jgi:phospholipase/carboxylesterase
MPLQHREFIQTQTPSSLMILLHGYGSNCEDLISLAPDFATSLPDTNFISPNAPFPFELGGFGGYQWYSLLDRTDSVMFEGAVNASEILKQFIDEQLSRFKLSYKDLILAGFSQGGMMTLHNAVRFPEKIKAAICFSGYISGENKLEHGIRSKPRVLITHGIEDNVVPVESAKKAFKILDSYNVPTEIVLSPGLGHGIDIKCINAAKKFLESI